MKLQFEPNQQYQLDAIQAVVDVFDGQPKDNGEIVIAGQAELGIDGQQMSLEATSTRGNILSLTSEQIAKNVHNVQRNNDIEISETKAAGFTLPATIPIELSYGKLVNGNNFSIEMETGTGKTYVYLRTIHELHEKYGCKKYIIVVPSVAIREGVLKNLEITKDHFDELYNKPEINHYVWDSKKTGQAREFATNDTLQIMVITIDSFAKSQNIMNKTSDYGRPLDYIKATRPIVIVDEPQNMETDIRKKAIESLNPLCTLRYSATHKHTYNLLYRLTPVDAYDKGLVKKIEVHSVMSDDNYNDAYISLLKVERSGKRSLVAHVEVDKSDERGLQRQILKVGPGADLEQLTGRSIYEGYIVEPIVFGEKSIEFSNGKVIYEGQQDESLHEEIMKRQIEVAVEDHFQKQLATPTIKVLSLFFIDKVANYRQYSESGAVQGKFSTWFEQAYTKIALKPKYAGIMQGLSAEDIHNGYFAADKNGNWKDSKDQKTGEGAKTKDDDGAYSLIMKDKEKLLSPDEPLRFIFSHSALREGWDNPNVFVICTLNESSSEMKKRQEIGRGLRLPVDTQGNRIRDENINVLTVVANESYDSFSRKLQTEIEDETGVSFGGRVKNRDDRRRIQLRKSAALDPSFRQLWDKIKHKTTYSVNINVDELILLAKEYLDEITISTPQLVDSITTLDSMQDGFKSRERQFKTAGIDQRANRIPDILSAVQSRTHVTRRVIFDVLDAADMFKKVPINPQQVIDGVSVAIEKAKNRLAVDGVKYVRSGEQYDMTLFDNHELRSYLYNEASKTGAIAVSETNKTFYDHVMVDSEIEYNFMRSLEQSENVKFYVKLPVWFKIDTPLGTYNPDWAIVFENDGRIYFVAETKGTNDIYDLHLGEGERSRIKAGRKHFSAIDVTYVAPVSSLNEAISKLM